MDKAFDKAFKDIAKLKANSEKILHAVEGARTKSQHYFDNAVANAALKDIFKTAKTKPDALTYSYIATALNLDYDDITSAQQQAIVDLFKVLSNPAVKNGPVLEQITENWSNTHNIDRTFMTEFAAPVAMALLYMGGKEVLLRYLAGG